MSAPFKDFFSSGKKQLDILGVLLLILLGILAWALLIPPFSASTVLPLLCVAYVASSIVYELTINRKNVPTLATTMVGRSKIAELLQVEAAKKAGTYTIVDLGSGRGQLTRKLAKSLPQAKIIGIEIAHLPCLQASFIQRLLGPKNLSYLCGDFWPFDCSNVDAVYFFLFPSMAIRIGEKLAKELKPGSLIISHSFPLGPEWTPETVLTYNSPFKEVIYIYRK